MILSNCASRVGWKGQESFGRRYNKDGNIDIGIWDPTVYANLDNDPGKDRDSKVSRLSSL